MGAWGPKLYQDEIADDVRQYYKDQLHRGKTGPEITDEMIEEFADYIKDSDDAPLFWFALADTQWSMGRLEEKVKEKALWYLSNDNGLERWLVNPKGYVIRKKVLQDLQEKLVSPPPKEKKVSQYRLYHNNWQIGDVYSYQFASDYAKDKGFFGRRAYMVKVGEEVWWPGHLIPIVYVYHVISEKTFSNEELAQYNFLPQFYVPEAYKKDTSRSFLFRLGLICTSERGIPKKQLTFQGNIGAVKPIENESIETYEVTWKDFEEYMIDNYCAWSLL